MLRTPTTAASALLFVILCCAPLDAQRQMENLTRGLVAVKQEDGGVYVGWRLFGTDPAGTAFNVYRVADGGEPAKVNDAPITGATNMVDEGAEPSQALEYFVRPIVDGEELAPSKPTSAWEDDYVEIPIQPLSEYRPGDASVADLDGDGELEIVLHQTSRGRDNSHTGVTGTPVFDAYEMDGTHLWRIDLGKNIREGEHYTQFMVYDLDGDGRAEMACKTADGTVDGQGEVIGDPDKDWRTLQPGSRRHGRVLDGPEYFTVFDGQTGAALETVDYIPARGNLNMWGGIGGNAGNDNYGNRVDRFLACVAYLDGERPSVIMCRGVYGRIVMAAWDWRDGELSVRWVFDTGISYPPYENASPFAGMGGHSLSVADVDDDGRDEIVYQAMVVDDNGEGLYSTGLRHGDSMHVSDMYPDRPGLEVFTIQENEEDAELFQTPGAAMRDARTGEILWRHSPAVDVGAGMAADIDPTHRGYEAWGGPGGLRDSEGESMGDAPRETGWCIWWDGDPLRELLSMGRAPFPRRPQQAGRPDRAQDGDDTERDDEDARGPRAVAGPREDRDARDRANWNDDQPSAQEEQEREERRRRFRRRFGPRPTRVMKWDWENERAETIYEADGYNAARGPAIMGDVLGDWREEMILVSADGASLRLYTSTIPTDRRLYTLLHDPQYRLGLVWQNVVYNKPCHPSFYLGDGMSDPPRPEIRLIGEGEAIRRTSGDE